MSSCTLGRVPVVDLLYNVNMKGDTNLVQIYKDAILKISHMAQPLVEEAESIRAASMEIVPFDMGILRASALEVGIQVDEKSNGVLVSFGYGGAAARYAIIQHETPPDVFDHLPGKTWKYLERPTMDAIAGMEGRIGAKLAALIENLGR